MRRSTITILLLATGLLAAGEGVTVFPAPDGVPISGRYRVSVRAAGTDGPWLPVPVYDFLEQHVYNRHPTAQYHVGVFVAQGDVAVRVEVLVPAGSAVVRPLSRDHGDAFDAASRTVTLGMGDAHRQVWIDVDGDLQQPLVLVSNPPDTGPPAGATVYGPGHHEAGEIAPASGETVYVAGGAVVAGRFAFDGREDVTIAGTGVVVTAGKPAVLAERSSRVAIRDLTFIKRGEGWGILPRASDQVTIDNVKLFSEIRDGIDPVNSQQVTARNCFIACHDDAMSPKGTHRGHGEPCEDILYENIVIAQMGGGNPLRLGVEANAPAMRRMTFRDITVIHALSHGKGGRKKVATWPEAVICIDTSAMMWVGDVDCHVSDILCERWIVENNREDFLVNIRPMQLPPHEVWGSTPRAGMSDITIRDLDVVAGPWKPSRVHGHPDARIERVRFEAIRERGEAKATLAAAGIDVNAHAAEVALSADTARNAE